jgi:phosphonate transport system ATP-binding protein
MRCTVLRQETISDHPCGQPLKTVMTANPKVPSPIFRAIGDVPIALRTQSLEVTYGNGARALRSTSLDFALGEFIVLLGASGAGKSTLLRSLNGLIRPSAGHVIATGVGDLSDAVNLRRHRRQTGMVFQQHHLIGRLSVLANVLMGRLGYHSALATLAPWSRAEKEAALAALDRVGLVERALDRADQLSGGQQQRVGIARALVQQPKVLLADEPVASLDPATAERLLTLLHGICRSDGLTLIVSLHQVEFARQFADRIIGLQNGAVAFDGTPAELTPSQADGLYGTAGATQRPSRPVPGAISFHPAGVTS